jgi:YVTN family beta-propeller protein
MNIRKRQAALLISVLFLAAAVLATAALQGTPVPLSPSALAASGNGKSLFVACATGRQVLEMDLAARKISRRIPLPGEASGLALSADGRRLYVTCSAPSSVVAVVDTAQSRVVETIPAGHSAEGPVLSPDGSLLYVCNRFNNDVAVIDVRSRRELRRIGVEREPVSAAVTLDGKLLLVANHLHNQRSDAEQVSAAVSVVDPHAGKVVKTLRLPNGSVSLQQIRISPDGRYAVVTHILAHHQVPTSQIERGWMSTNAVSIIDVANLSLVNTVLLDGPFRGAANPWGIAWTPDGKQFVAAHAGTHEVSITQFPALLDKLHAVPAKVDPSKKLTTVAASETKADVPHDLSFLSELRQTIRLLNADRGPRALAIAGGNLYTANYFSGTLSVVNLATPARAPESIPLAPKQVPSIVRSGEAWFHDADLCFQGWQSCLSCHPGVRTDALNWDLLNDGAGNPKNTKSLLLSHKTPPAMSLGIRETAETAVRSGIRYILFTQQPPNVAAAIDAYLKSLKPLPSPHLKAGRLSEAAERGKAIFHQKEVGCATCHPSGYFTDLKPYDVGTAGRHDVIGDKIDTPTLVESWRTAPYLHDGSAATMEDVLTVRNPKDKHGVTSRLSPSQIKDLAEYVLSL